MKTKYPTIFFALPLFLLAAAFPLCASTGQPQGPEEKESPAPSVSLPGTLSGYLGQPASKIEAAYNANAPLFEKVPQGWTRNTIESLRDWVLALPLDAPAVLRRLLERVRASDIIPILVVAIAAILYRTVGQKRVLAAAERELQSLWNKIPETVRPGLPSVLKMAASVLPPLLLLFSFLLVEGFLHPPSPGFIFAEKLLKLWAVAVLTLHFLRGVMLGGLLRFCPRHGKTLFRLLRPVLIYVAAGIGALWAGEAMQLRGDIQAFFEFVVSVTIVCALFLVFLKKEALLSLLPRLPGRGYGAFLRFLDRAFSPLAALTFAAGLLWCFGYKNLAGFIWGKTWGVAGAYVAIMIVYHFLSHRLDLWSEGEKGRSEEAQNFHRSARALLVYATIAVASLVILDIVGVLNLLKRIVSYPLVHTGSMSLSVWTFAGAGLILLAFLYASRLLLAYLDYRIYPSMGVDAGLAYALNTFFRYTLLALGLLFALRAVGFDLRVLMVFAGGVGLGTGLGLQSIASSIISGFTLVFGRKLRKGDWIMVGDKVGMVTHIYLRITKVWTRDNIEYLIPNNDLVSNMIVNYTLSSPIVRIYIPVGVSYDADPALVKQVLIEAANKNPTATEYRKPEVRLLEFADSSINYELLIWIDVRSIAEKDIRSRMNFLIWEALNEAGIQIPFPQRDIHIRSGALPAPNLEAEGGAKHRK